MDTTQLERAQDFMWHYARLLERQLFAFLFHQGPKAPVLAALRAYQNEDGGFGHGLEPDKRAPTSQPVDVEVAFHILDLLDAFDDPMVGSACDFLMTITTEAGGVPFALPSVRNYPRAPWWEVDDAPPAALNPTAAIVGLLRKHGVDHPWVARASDFCWEAIATLESNDFHTLMPVITFLEHSPDQARAAQVLHQIKARITQAGVVALDPKATGYVKKPLDWAPMPTSVCRTLFDDAMLVSHLTTLAAQQQPDGGWPLSWEPISPAVAYEWRGRVTIDALHTLQQYQAAGLG